MNPMGLGSADGKKRQSGVTKRNGPIGRDTFYRATRPRGIGRLRAWLARSLGRSGRPERRGAARYRAAPHGIRRRV